ncbi:MAG: hypothetical protein AB7H77_00985 [Bdellovibrionales bacterium]
MKGQGVKFFGEFTLAVLLCLPAYAVETPSVKAAPEPAKPPSYTEPQREYLKQLDKLLAERNYLELGNKVMRPADVSYVGPVMDWAKLKTFTGKSEIVPLLYAQLLWGLAGTNPQFADLKETAALMTVYALLVNYADGSRCADPSAPSHHINTIFTNYRGQLQYISQLPDHKRDRLARTAMAMEQKLAPMRGDDDYMCRFGLAEINHGLEKYGEGKDVPDSQGHIGRTKEIPTDPDFRPQFLPREKWEVKQAEARTHFPELLAALAHPARLPEAPTQDPKTP